MRSINVEIVAMLLYVCELYLKKKENRSVSLLSIVRSLVKCVRLRLTCEYDDRVKKCQERKHCLACIQKHT